MKLKDLIKKILKELMTTDAAPGYNSKYFLLNPDDEERHIKRVTKLGSIIIKNKLQSRN